MIAISNFTNILEVRLVTNHIINLKSLSARGNHSNYLCGALRGATLMATGASIIQPSVIFQFEILGLMQQQ